MGVPHIDPLERGLEDLRLALGARGLVEAREVDEDAEVGDAVPLELIPPRIAATGARIEARGVSEAVRGWGLVAGSAAGGREKALGCERAKSPRTTLFIPAFDPPRKCSDAHSELTMSLRVMPFGSGSPLARQKCETAIKGSELVDVARA